MVALLSDILLKVDEWVGCDKCSARAQIKTELPYGELWFCMHHYNENAQALTEQGAIAKLLDLKKD